MKAGKLQASIKMSRYLQRARSESKYVFLQMKNKAIKRRVIFEESMQYAKYRN